MVRQGDGRRAGRYGTAPPSGSRAANDGAAATRAWLERHERSAITDYASATATYRFVKALILIGGPLMVLFCLAVAVTIARSLSSGVALILACLRDIRVRQIAVVREGVVAMAEDELSATVQVERLPLDVGRRDGIGELAEALNPVDEEVGAMASAVERSREPLRPGCMRPPQPCSVSRPAASRPRSVVMIRGISVSCVMP